MKISAPALRIVAFALLVFLPLAAGEAWLRRQHNPSASKHAWLSAHSREVQTLVLGSSHTYYGIAPELLGVHAYNAAQVSQTLRYDDWLLSAYPFPRLRQVIVPVSDFTLYEELEDGPEWHLASRYRIYMHCDIHPRFGVYGWESTHFPSFCQKLTQLWKPRRMHWSHLGQGLEYTLADRSDDWDNGAARAAHNAYTDLSQAPRGIAHLERIAARCHQQGARLVLVMTPLRPSYSSAQLPAQVRDTERRIAAFVARHPHEAVLLDYRAHPSFTAADFYDADHLNTDGARKLSLLIRAALGGDNLLSASGRARSANHYALTQELA